MNHIFVRFLGRLARRPTNQYAVVLWAVRFRTFVNAFDCALQGAQKPHGFRMLVGILHNAPAMRVFVRVCGRLALSAQIRLCVFVRLHTHRDNQRTADNQYLQV